ncbi:MAG: DUF3667 domain-containing protein [Flavobacteriaceae bacterium]|nr:DUF3667 domain-containing protein [Flavobacteriaceae bacterium]
METSKTYCKNCEALTENSYCSNCGQRTSVRTVTFKETFGDLASGLFSFEAPFWKTLGLLFTNPGKLFREYLGGKRKTYFKPVSFFILLTALHIVIRSLLDYDPMAAAPEGSDYAVNLFREAGQFMVQNINNILFIFVFTLSLLMKLFFYKKYSWAEYIAVAFYLVGVYILLGTINFFLLVFLNTGMQFLTMLVMLLYFLYAMVSFFQTRKVLVAVKSLLVYALGTLFYVALGFGLALLIVYFT